MSSGFDKMITNCYIVSMDRGELAAWLERKYLEWQLENGRENIDVFANHLGISQPYLSLIMTGTRKSIGMKTALKIARRLNDYSIMDLLGYALPEQRSFIPFDSLPPEFLARLQSIDSEIKNTLRERAITEYSSEAEEVALEILEKYGAKLISTPKSRKSSN